MTPTGYAAQVALGAARDATSTTPDADREVLLELMACRTQLRRYGSNLNQGTRVLNAGGGPPELHLAISKASFVVERIDSLVKRLT